MRNMTKTELIAEIADGYSEASLFTADNDAGGGEYQADPGEVELLREPALEAAAAFVHIVGDGLIQSLDIDAERVGNCLHYDRDGHGCGFSDEEGYGMRGGYALERCETVARFMGTDDEMGGCVAEVLDARSTGEETEEE